MKVSDLMQAMSDAGAPMEAILIAVRAIEERDAIVEQKRAVEAERTQRYRQRGGGQVSPLLRAEILERDGHQCLECATTECLEIDHIIPLAKGGDPVHRDNLQTLCRPCNARKRDRVRKSDNRGKMRTIEDSEVVPADPPLSRPPNDIYSNPPTHTPPETKTRARKGTRLPVDWTPAPLPSDLASVVCQWPASAVPRELGRFRDWAASATGSNAIKSDWNAAWRNWLRKCEDEGRYGRQINGSSGSTTTDPMIARILAKKAEREAHPT